MDIFFDIYYYLRNGYLAEVLVLILFLFFLFYLDNLAKYKILQKTILTEIVIILLTMSAISCLDTRYIDDVKPLIHICDEFAYYRNRIYIELEYFKAFCNITLDYNPFLDFKESDYTQILEKEAVLRHDVKAIEYFIKSLPVVQATGKAHLIHIGLTSQDVCSPAFIMCFDASIDIILGKLSLLSNVINNQLIEHQDANILMLGLTHGQPATPTLLKKEMQIYQNRLDRIYMELKHIHTYEGYTVKFGGATGNWNAMEFTRPSEKWTAWLNNFIYNLEPRGRYHRSQYTNQCDDYDSIIRVLYIIKRILHILEHFRSNIWLYIHRGILKQIAISGEIGSSTMPNKVNPIDIENAKTAIEMAKRLIDGICDILTETSYQRDVSDSSAVRNISSVFGYVLIAINKITKGINRLIPNKEFIQVELDCHPEVILEGIQTYLKVNCKVANAYEIMKDVSRGQTGITLTRIHEVIDTLDITDVHKDKLKLLTPSNYTGIL